MLAKMARSAPSAAVRSVNGDDSRPRRQPGLPKRGENAKIRGGSEFIRRIPVQSRSWLWRRARAIGQKRSYRVVARLAGNLSE
jgi:hypothetical protein